jgi:hypothetical protein
MAGPAGLEEGQRHIAPGQWRFFNLVNLPERKGQKRT